MRCTGGWHARRNGCSTCFRSGEWYDATGRRRGGGVPGLPACTFCIGCRKAGFTGGSGRRGPVTSGGNLVLGTDIPAHGCDNSEPSTTATPSTRSWRGAWKMVGEIRNPTRDPCAILGFVADRYDLRPRHPLSAPKSRRRRGIRPRNAGGSRPTVGATVSCRYLHYGHRLSVLAQAHRRSMVSAISRARSISPVAGPR